MCCPPQLTAPLALAVSLLCLAGCDTTSSQDYIEATEVVTASAVVQSSWQPGTGFVIDREERLLVTTYRSLNQKNEVEVVFPIIADGKALVRKSAWLDNAKERTIKAKVLVADPLRDLAILCLESVPDDVVELKLAKAGAAKGTTVTYIGAGDKSSLAWSGATSTVNKVRLREIPVKGHKTIKYRMVELEAAGEMAKEVSGGALLNESNEVVGVLADDSMQKKGLLCTDLSELRPVVAGAYRIFTMQAYADEDFDAALKYSNQALAVWPEDALGYNERGAAWSQKDDLPKAIADYTQALKLEKRLAVAWRNRASAYRHLHKYKEAIADATQAIALNPNYRSAYEVRGDCFAKLGKVPEAAQDELCFNALQPGWKVTSQTGNKKYRNALAEYLDPAGECDEDGSITDIYGRKYYRDGAGFYHGRNGSFGVKISRP